MIAICLIAFALLDVLHAVEDRNHLHLRKAFVGETVHIQCGDGNTLNNSVSWRYQAQLGTEPRQIGSTANLTSDGFEGRLEVTKTLIISDLKAEDNGIYTCVDDAGSVQYRVRLAVYAEKQNASETISAVAGQRVTLPCSTTLSTPVDWYHLPSANERGDVICAAGNLVNGYSGRFEIDRRAKGDYNLIIQTVKREDDGVYVCREDAGQSTAHHMTLRVQNIRITLQVTAVVGERVTLPCRTSLTTPVDWYYLVSENGRASTICAAGRMVNGYGSRFELQTSHLGDSNLVILNVSREDEGEYICREDAGHGPVHRVKLNVLKHVVRLQASRMVTSQPSDAGLRRVFTASVVLTERRVQEITSKNSKEGSVFIVLAVFVPCQRVSDILMNIIKPMHRGEWLRGAEEQAGSFPSALAEPYQERENMLSSALSQSTV